MSLNPPKKSTFWTSIIIAALGFIIYLLGHFNVILVDWLGLAGVILVVAAFILLSVSLTTKGL